MSALKGEIRERIWRLLEEKGVARFPRPVRGRIPNFVGAEAAAERFLELEEFRRSRAVKVNPDAPQLPVRRGVLRAGKLLLMPTPRLREGFLLLDPARIPERNHAEASTIRGSFRFGAKVGLSEIPPVDLVVCGSVAVSLAGARVGKGGGYSELEYGVLRDSGLVGEGTQIATTTHELQLVDSAPVEEFDFTVDFIATPEKLIRTTGPRHRPWGIIWEKLSEEQKREIPMLGELGKRRMPKFKEDRVGRASSI